MVGNDGDLLWYNPQKITLNTSKWFLLTLIDIRRGFESLPPFFVEFNIIYANRQAEIKSLLTSSPPISEYIYIYTHINLHIRRYARNHLTSFKRAIVFF